MPLSTLVGLFTGIELAKKLEEPTKKAFGSLFEKGKDKYDEHKLQQAFNELAEKTNKVIEIRTIYTGHNLIDLHDIYIPTKIQEIDHDINCVSDISDKSIVLEGTVGQGKSIFMRYLTYQEAKKGQRVPIFYELRNLKEGQTLTNAISTKISNWLPEFTEKDFASVAETGNLVLFLDGFDELSYEKTKIIFPELEDWCDRYPTMQVIISSRPDADIQKSTYLHVHKLSKYRFYEQSLLIDKLVDDKKIKGLLKQSIKNSSTEIQELLKTPLMVTLLVMKYGNNFEIPSNQYEFYKDLFHVLAVRHDGTKPIFKRSFNSNLNQTQLQEIFEEFCFISLSMNKLTFDASEAIEILTECLETQNIDENPQNILNDLSKNICLILKDGLQYTFVHKSIQEYFCAEFIKDQPEMKIDFYDKCRLNCDYFVKNENTLNFLKSIDTYYYYKYFSIGFFEKLVEDFSIDGESSNIINYLFSKNSVDDATDIESCIQMLSNKYDSEYFHFFDYSGFFNISLTPFLNQIAQSLSITCEKPNLLLFEPAIEFYETEEYEEIKIEYLKVERYILHKRDEMLNYINKKSTNNYKKYLRKK